MIWGLLRKDLSKTVAKANPDKKEVLLVAKQTQQFWTKIKQAINDLKPYVHDPKKKVKKKVKSTSGD